MWYLILITATLAWCNREIQHHHSHHLPASHRYDDSWELERNDDGIALYSRESSGRDYREYKGVTRFTASPADVMKLLGDVRSYPSWLYTCREAKLLKHAGPGEDYLYFVYDVPVYSNRDAVMHSCTVRRTDGSGATMKFSRVDRPRTGVLFRDAGLKRDDGNEYVKELSVMWSLVRVGREVEVTYSIYLDPDIGFPGSLRVNATTEGLVFESLKKMRTMLANPAYRNAPASTIDELPVKASCF